MRQDVSRGGTSGPRQDLKTPWQERGTNSQLVLVIKSKYWVILLLNLEDIKNSDFFVTPMKNNPNLLLVVTQMNTGNQSGKDASMSDVWCILEDRDAEKGHRPLLPSGRHSFRIEKREAHLQRCTGGRPALSALSGPFRCGRKLPERKDRNLWKMLAMPG